MNFKVVASIGIAVLALGTSQIFAAGPNNAVCRVQFPKGIGQGILTIKDGKPVAYRTKNWKATKVSRSGNTIRANEAVFKITSESPTSLVGNWTLGAYRFNNLTFSCR